MSQPSSVSSSSPSREGVAKILSAAFDRAQAIVRDETQGQLEDSLPEEVRNDFRDLLARRHNGRGIVLTLLACKLECPEQDIRAHKAEHPGGFNARGIDTEVTIPLLREWGLAAAGESHWLTQIFSGGPFSADQVLRTQPKIVGELVPRLVSRTNDFKPTDINNCLCAMFVTLIQERNRGQIPLTRPKNLTIDQALSLLGHHFTAQYSTGGPRLPQLAFYAIYECLIVESKRYSGHSLVPVERMKTANRKSGTVGDVDVLHEGRAVEAVEIKSGMAVTARHVSDAIEKIKAADIKRYYILATEGVSEDEAGEIDRQISAFYRSNGCEIIVNGIYDSLRYYLRLIGEVRDFIAAYVDLIAKDADVTYEHRVAWNEACDADLGGA